MVMLQMQSSKQLSEYEVSPHIVPPLSSLRFYYETKEKKCKMFIYGGCRGNGNNFLTEEECKKKCMQDNWFDVARTSNEA
ncbi:Kunitz/Bovine pancreatic trypsin inhibitor domain protein [Ancylostoma duodenale]|uniref:Kunitz/Bovine pancreatic trypsin inhibitor domain protein n=1 Tax=Ancylostoma duodenale TaxID=51022 RepID=A0A0C2G8R6_9BILA|nr:Kunitz/Bovine pancreatic trypsin inhibitor domain protein [Ancylostoma duodenale]